MGTFLSLTCVGAVFALLLWLQEITRRWSNPLSFLIPLASIGAVLAVNAWETRDGLRRPDALAIAGGVAVLGPGLFLGLLDWIREPSVLGFLRELVGAVARTFSHLGRIGWALLPALYAGASLCRRKHRIRPRTDLWFWALMTTLASVVWLRPDTGLFGQPARPLEDRIWTYLAGAATGVLVGWRFARTGYPPAR